MALDFGHLRLKGKGGSGGHNGLKSLQAHLKTPDYSRLKIGVGGANGTITENHYKMMALCKRTTLLKNGTVRERHYNTTKL